MKFDVFLPSLLVSPDWFADSAPPRLLAIETLLARGASHVSGEWPNVLLAAFGAVDAIAPCSLIGDGFEADTRGWMFAEPVHLQADRDALKLFPASHLDITAAEATQLVGALNENFADRDLFFSRGASGCWYVSCRVEELPQTTPVSQAQRGALMEKLPRSRGKISWKAIQNETQMLLHAHPVNAAREASAKMTINGVWFWGEGGHHAPPISVKPSIGAVFGDTPLARGLAKWAAARLKPLAQFTLADTASLTDRNLLMIDSLEILHERGDVSAWRDTAHQLDAEIFTPLLAALRSGVIDEVVLTLPRADDSLVVSIHAQSFRGSFGWWKNLTETPRPFVEYCLA